MKIKLFCLTSLLLVAAAVSAEEWKRDFAVGAHPQLRVQTNDASIDVRGGAGNTISVRVVAEGRHIGPGELSVNAQQSGDAISLQVKIPERHEFAVIVRKDQTSFNTVQQMAGRTFCAHAPPNLGTLVLLSQFDNPSRQPMIINTKGWELNC